MNELRLSKILEELGKSNQTVKIILQTLTQVCLMFVLKSEEMSKKCKRI